MDVGRNEGGMDGWESEGDEVEGEGRRSGWKWEETRAVDKKRKETYANESYKNAKAYTIRNQPCFPLTPRRTHRQPIHLTH